MDKFLINLLKNFKLSVEETISVFILILVIMLITKIFIRKKWITEEQSVISSIVIVFLDTILLYAGSDAMAKFLATIQLLSNVGLIITIVIQRFFQNKKMEDNKESTSDQIVVQAIVQAIPDNTILFIKGDEQTILTIAYDKKAREYVCYENLYRLKNIKPADLFEAVYADVLIEDTYSYRNMFNKLTSNTEPKEEDYVFVSTWLSRIDKDENYNGLKDFCRQCLLDYKDLLKGIKEADISIVITKSIPDEGEKVLTAERLQYFKANFKSHNFYRTDITKKKGGKIQ